MQALTGQIWLRIAHIGDNVLTSRVFLSIEISFEAGKAQKTHRADNAEVGSIQSPSVDKLFQGLRLSAGH